jgi:hypothetical protein
VNAGLFFTLLSLRLAVAVEQDLSPRDAEYDGKDANHDSSRFESHTNISLLHDCDAALVRPVVHTVTIENHRRVKRGNSF